MKYTIYIKSHCEAPDYEDECEAVDKIHASVIFGRRINSRSKEFWGSKDLLDYITLKTIEDRAEIDEDFETDNARNNGIWKL